ncbi:hypothetical protein Tco_1511221 [Tanacetum coccineum]
MSVKNARTTIQEMADHSEMWHDGASKRHKGNDNFDGLAALIAQLSNLGREMKKMTEKVHDTCRGRKRKNTRRFEA